MPGVQPMVCQAQTQRKSQPPLRIATAQRKRLSGKQGQRTLDLDEGLTQHVLSYLDNAAPGAHRAAARSFVGRRAQRSFVLFKDPKQVAAVSFIKLRGDGGAVEETTNGNGGLQASQPEHDEATEVESTMGDEEDGDNDSQEDDEEREEEGTLSLCELCGATVVRYDDEEDDMVVALVAVAKVNSFMDVHCLPLCAKKLLWDKLKWVEMNICVGDSYFRDKCYNKFLLADEVEDEDAPFWLAQAGA